MRIGLPLKKNTLKQLKAKQKNKGGCFLGMLSGTLGTDLLGYMLAGKGLVAIRQGKSEVVRTRAGGVIRAGDWVSRTRQDV